MGAGIQGISVALALSNNGYKVQLIDQSQALFNRASLRNEGKIHLGLVYAKDTSLRTAKLMLKGALSFAPIMEELLGFRPQWDRYISTPFSYLIAHDSMVKRKELQSFYEDLESHFNSLPKAEKSNYLGQVPKCLVSNRSIPRFIDQNYVQGYIGTSELALDLILFREILLKVVHASENINIFTGHRILEINRKSQGFELLGRISRRRKKWSMRADIAVNCLWEGRIALDQQLGYLPKDPWINRLKLRVLVRRPKTLRSLRSMTMVLGPYGDIVTWPGTDLTYLSWYPACMKDWSKAVQIPGAWQATSDGYLQKQKAREVANDTLSAFGKLIPEITKSQLVSVDGGIIHAIGQTDITDHQSSLHKRDKIGIMAKDGYFSINTGKFTTAPLFTKQLLNYF